MFLLRGSTALEWLEHGKRRLVSPYPRSCLGFACLEMRQTVKRSFKRLPTACSCEDETRPLWADSASAAYCNFYLRNYNNDNSSRRHQRIYSSAHAQQKHMHLHLRRNNIRPPIQHSIQQKPRLKLRIQPYPNSTQHPSTVPLPNPLANDVTLKQ